MNANRGCFILFCPFFLTLFGFSGASKLSPEAADLSGGSSLDSERSSAAAAASHREAPSELAERGAVPLAPEEVSAVGVGPEVGPGGDGGEVRERIGPVLVSIVVHALTDF